MFLTKKQIMEKLLGSSGKLVNKIYEYQRFISLNLQFITALEQEGADTTNLRAEINVLEGKMAELKLRGSHSF